MPEEGNERSEEVREILGREPIWPLRWGSLLILFLLLALLFYSWTVSYPKLAEGEMTLSGDPPPVRVSNPSSGPLGRIRKKQGEKVKEGEEILFIGSEQVHRELERTEQFLQRIRNKLKDGKPLPRLPRIELREIEALQGRYEGVEQALLEYREAHRNGPEGVRRLSRRIRLSKELLEDRKARRELAEKALEQERKAHQRQESLAEKGAIPLSELQRSEQELLRQKGSLEEIRAGEAQVKIRLNELRAEKARRIANDEEELRRRKEELKMALRILERACQLQRSSRTLRAPVKGRVSHLRPLHQGERLTLDNPVVAVIPEGADLRARVSLPSEGSAGIEKGQEVRLHLHEYPSERFGVLKGKVEDRSELPTEGKFHLRVELTNGLRTTHGERIRPKAQLNGRAEIVTHKEPLLYRVFAP